MGEEIIIFITASSQEEALKIGKTLVEERLAACVNIVPGVRSIFYWDHKIQDESEVLLLCKSRLSLMATLTARVKSIHSYTVPEIIALPIAAGSEEYRQWIAETTQGTQV